MAKESKPSGAKINRSVKDGNVSNKDGERVRPNTNRPTQRYKDVNQNPDKTKDT